jgi:Protein of unknown function (DUF1579)
MKKYTLFTSLLAVIFISGKLVAQTTEEQKAYVAFMTPGPTQQMIAKSAGTWTGTVTMWTPENATPTTSTMEATNTMILGGRYLQSSNKGTMMGQPFEGIGVTGYDNSKKVFVSSWVDNMGTGMIFMEGTWDASTNSMLLSGKNTDPLTGKDVPIREIMKFVDDNHQELVIYFTEKGKEFKGMEIKYVRK